MKSQLNLIFCLTTLLLGSCQVTQEEDLLTTNLYVDEQDTFTLSSNPIEVKPEIIGYIVDIKSIEDYIIATADFGSHAYMAINVITGETFRFGSIGEGPNEVASLSQLELYNSGDTKRLKTYNLNKLRVDDFKWNETISTRSIMFDSTRSVKIPLMVHKMAYLKESNTYLTVGTFNQKRFRLYSNEGKLLQEFGEYPFEQEFKNVSPENLAMAFQGNFEVDSTGRYVAFAITDAACLDFFEIQNGKVSVIKQHHVTKPLFEASTTPNEYWAAVKEENKMGFISTASDQDFVYVLYSGKSFEEGMEEAMTGNTVYVYDWQGNLRHKLLLDQKVHFITVNPKTRQLLAVINGEKTSFVSFNLPDFKR